MSGAAQSGRVGGASLPTYVVGGGVSADYSFVSVPATLTADGVESATITIQTMWQALTDGEYVPMADVAASEIVVAVSGSNNTITQPTAKTNASGVTTASFKTTTAEAKTITVTVRGRLLTQTGTCTAGGAAGSSFTDTFETGDRAASSGGYGWSGVNSGSNIAGTGTNGTFTRTDGGQWATNILAGVPVYLEDTATGSPVAVGPFTVTSNTTTVLTFTGDASTADRMRDADPRVVSGNAYAGTYSLEFRYGPDRTDITDYSFSEQRYTFGANLSEVWIQYYLKVPVGYVHRDQLASGENNKFFSVIWADNYSGIDRMFVDLETDRNATTGGSKLFCQTNHATTSAAITIPTPQVQLADIISTTGVIVPGTWTRIRIHAKVASAAESNDGVLELWGDNTLMFQKTNGRFWYPSGSSLYGTTPFFRNGYLQGYCNSGFTAETLIYIDNVNVYSSDPSWTF